MLDFDFSDEQMMLQSEVRKFCKKKILPIVRKMEDERRIPDDIVKGLAELGLLGMTVGKEYGGLEADPVTVGLAAEELARTDISCAVPTFFLVEAVWGYILNKYGREEIKREILPGVTSGEACLGIAVTEPDAGSDVSRMKTRAVRTKNAYVVNGEKMYVGGILEATSQFPGGGGHLTLVKTDEQKGTRGMSMLYIRAREKEGMSITVLEDWGRKGISFGGFAMEDVRVPEQYLLGAENRGFYITMEGFDFARGVISLVSCGAAMNALEQAMEYVKIRKAFDRPLGQFEGIQFKLAEHWAKLDAIRALGYKALWMYGKEQREKRFSRFEVSRVCAEAKMLAPAAAFEAINDAIQWFGAFGYTTECPLEIALRGVRSYFWAEGALEVMKLIVSRELLGKEFIV